MTWALLDVPVLPVYPIWDMYVLLCPSQMLLWLLQHLSLCFRPNALFGMGNPLLDISAVVDKDFLDKWVKEASGHFKGVLTSGWRAHWWLTRKSGRVVVVHWNKKCHCTYCTIYAQTRIMKGKNNVKWIVCTKREREVFWFDECT